MRKVIQITTGMFNNDHVLIALCNDGSTWELQNGAWHELPGIPQPDSRVSLFPQLVRCDAMQHSDQMVCEKCGLAWDMNDSAPPTCATAAPVRKKRFARLREFLKR